MNSRIYTLEDFLKEYDERKHAEKERLYTGLEFVYENSNYRIAREDGDNSKFYLYQVFYLNKENEYSSPNFKCEVLATYNDIDELLANGSIKGVNIKKILFEGLSKITWQD